MSGLAKPQDMVFYKSGSTMYLYVSEKNQVSRAVYNNGDLTMRSRQVVVSGLPDASSPGLDRKTLRLHRVHLQRLRQRHSEQPGASFHICLQCRRHRWATLRPRPAQCGGLAFVPTRSILWVVVNNRDDVPYPFNDASGNYGQVFSGYVDDHPPELFTSVKDGGNYGWPFCNSNRSTPSGLDNLPLDPDYDTNRSGSVKCGTMTNATKGIPAHSAPLGLTFMQRSKFPQYYRRGAMVALHGSWNRTTFLGGKVAHFPWDGSQRPGQQFDFVSGWLNGNNCWGRPVDTAVDSTGGLLISDDLSGTVYRLWQTGSIP